jgi:hypothetical protein
MWEKNDIWLSIKATINVNVSKAEEVANRVLRNYQTLSEK